MSDKNRIFNSSCFFLKAIIQSGEWIGGEKEAPPKRDSSNIRQHRARLIVRSHSRVKTFCTLIELASVELTEPEEERKDGEQTSLAGGGGGGEHSGETISS